MNTELIKSNLQYVTAALIGLCLAMVILTVAKASAHVYSLGKIETVVENAKENSETDDETVKKYLGKGKEIVGELRKKNMFVNPPSKPQPPVCYGIIGNSALINGKQYKVGDKIGSAEVLAVGTKDVTIMWEEKEMKLIPFQQGYRPSSGGKPSPPSSENKDAESAPKPATTTVVSGSPEGVRPGMGPGMGSGRGGFMGMSPEDRQRMIDRYRSMSPEEQQRFRDEQRRRMMEGGGFRGGPRGGRGR